MTRMADMARAAVPVARGAGLAAGLLATVLAAGCGGGSSTRAEAPVASSSAARTATAPAAVRATLRASTHRPRVNAPWTYVVRVRDAAGRPIRARVHLQVLFNGVPVGEIGVHRVLGVWRETIRWPPASVGHPLVFRAEVTARGRTLRLDYPLVVRSR
jgi:hypothetical protein